MEIFFLKENVRKGICTIPLMTRLFGWVIITVQFFSSLTLLFPSGIVHAQNEKKWLSAPASRSTDIRVYRLAEGETVQSVARKFSISLADLRQLNQRRNFTGEFGQLKPGDELDVPLSPLPVLRWDDEKTSPSGTEQEQQQKMANLASRTGTVLSSSSVKQAGISLAQGAVTSRIGGDIQQWLSQFGTARLQLKMDNHYSLRGSGLEMLAPLYERSDRLIFTQGSLHRTDDRTQSNLGFGLRQFDKRWITGVNAFLDYDLSREHARVGIGMEYWRNFLHLSLNSYMRLTDWKEGVVLSNHQARPANGWDMRVESWLPALPHLGIKMMYQKYYGDEVALFDRENRQRNPYAISGGVTFTPFPLLTLSAEQRRGKLGKNDSLLGMQMHYQIGVPWQRQISPAAVSAMRTLAGNRYALVERNNNILLDYRKKESLSLRTVGQVNGYPGESKSLQVAVSSQYGLRQINWEASEFIAAGGKIAQQNAGHWQLVLPAFNSGSRAVNHYTVTGIAVDKKGNISSPATTQVTVNEAVVSIGKSSFTPEAVTLPADGRSQVTLKLSLNDRQGRPVDIQENEVSAQLENKTRKRSQLTAFSRNAPGEYSIRLTAGTQPESLIITPIVRKMRLGSARVLITADETTAQISDENLTVRPEISVADGQTAKTISALVTDRQGNPLAAVKVKFHTSQGTLADEWGVTDDWGMATTTLTSTTAGVTHVTVTVNHQTVFRNTHFSLENVNAIVASVTPGAGPYIVDDETGVLFSALVNNEWGNPLSGVTVKWTSDREGEGVRFSATQSVTNAQGIAETRLFSTRALSVRVKGTLYSVSDTALPITFLAGDPDSESSMFEADKSVINADGLDPAGLTVTLRDRFANPVIGKRVTISRSGIGVVLSAVKDNQDGSYQARATSTTQGQFTLTAMADGKPISSSVELRVNAVSSQLSFSKPQQKVTYTRNFTASQSVQGATADLPLMWVSSKPAVASVDADTGKITLHKAGEAIITVSTQGIGQFNPHKASYQLTVEKADPLLSVTSGHPIVATWRDGKTYKLVTTFENKDADNDLIPRFDSQDKYVVETRSDGTLQALKPGNTDIVVYTPENERFKAATVKVAYTLNKANAAVTFQFKQQEGTSDKFSLQMPNRLPSDVQMKWSSSDNNVVNLSDSGEVQGRVGQGRTRLTLRVVANDFYHASSGYYDVLIYSQPVIKLESISHKSAGKIGSGDIWSPVFTDDELTVRWKIDGTGSYNYIKSVNIYLKDANDRVLAEAVSDKLSGSSTVFTPQASFWAKTVRVEIVAKGHSGDGDIGRTQSSNFTVSNLPPDKIWTNLVLKSSVETRSSEGIDSSCRETWFGRLHWNNVIFEYGSIGFDGKILLSPMDFTLKIVVSNNENLSFEKEGAGKNVQVIADQKLYFGKVEVHKNCWKNHYGSYRLKVNVAYDGKSYSYEAANNHGWAGNGVGMYRGYTDYFN